MEPSIREERKVFGLKKSVFIEHQNTFPSPQTHQRKKCCCLFSWGGWVKATHAWVLYFSLWIGKNTICSRRGFCWGQFLPVDNLFNTCNIFRNKQSYCRINMAYSIHCDQSWNTKFSRQLLAMSFDFTDTLRCFLHDPSISFSSWTTTERRVTRIQDFHSSYCVSWGCSLFLH